MSTTWRSEDVPDTAPIGLAGWVRVVRRGLPTALLTFGGLGVLLLVRIVERPLCGMQRPVTPHITQFVCRGALRLLGIARIVEGQPMADRGAIVANHGSWLDIFVLNASKRIYFVSKSEVARWPGIGWLARATGTLFISRRPAEARVQTALFQARLAAGHKLLFFPEGTSSDGQRVLPFKSTLFAAFFDPAFRRDLSIQPVTVTYHAPVGANPRFYGWWGDMSFGAHLLKTLAARRQGRVEVVYHAPVRVADFADRKALTHHLETVVRDGLRSGAGAG